jgi:hypothetical protein
MPLISSTSQVIPTSTLVFGLGASGKSQHIAKEIIEKHQGKKILWLTLDNTAVFENLSLLLDWFDIGVYKDWGSFKAQADAAIKSGSYDVIVVDGLAALHRLAIKNVAKGDQPSIPEWGKMSNDVHSLIRALKDASTHFYASLLLKSENIAPQGATPNIVTSFDVNSDLQKRLIPEFNRKLYAYVQPRFDDKNVAVGLDYVIQHNPAAALRFSQLQFS